MKYKTDFKKYWKSEVDKYKIISVEIKRSERADFVDCVLILVSSWRGWRCSCTVQLLNLKGHIEALSGADRKQTRKQSSPTYAEHWKHCNKENLKNHALHHDRRPMEVIFLCLNSCQRNNKKLHNACNFLLKLYINLKMIKYTPVFVCVLVLRFCRALPCRGR